MSYKVVALQILFLSSLCAQTPGQSTFITLFEFPSDGSEGANPQASLVQGTDGNLYGTTSSGGASNGGTVFQITTSGTLKTLKDFVDLTGGRYPNGLVLDTNGALYGTTSAGGGSSASGTIYAITQSGDYYHLSNFFASGTGARSPEAGLIQATDGLLYGTTSFGGTANLGTIFRATSGGAVTVIHSFDGTDGMLPLATLVQASNGALYGNTDQGGQFNAGVIYRITLGGAFTALDSVGQAPTGAYPQGALVQATNGALYGTTSGDGTVFRITPQGALATLVAFDEKNGHGYNPVAGVIQATDGNFYGTTHNGGSNGGGTIFRMTPSGGLTFLWSLDANSQASDALLQATDGNFYGTTSGGGLGSGTVFSLNIGLPPFIKTLPLAAATSTAVKILGTSLAGATAVSFNGLSAKFTVVSPTLIQTTVPANAVTGPVQVTLPTGTLTSNVPFRVLP